MRSELFLAAVTALPFACLLSGESNAAFIGFANNPTSNSTDWETSVTSAGGTVVINDNFTDPSTGALVTIGSGFVNMNSVAGPGQSGNMNPLSTGEGTHPVSDFLQQGIPVQGGAQPPVTVLTVTFDTPVLGAGFFTIDYFGPQADTNILTLSAFGGPDGTGSFIGSVTGVHFNFQPNNMYFMGVESTDGDIRSITFSRGSDSTGDIIGIDNIESAVLSSRPVPEPTTLALIGIALGALGFVQSRRLRHVAPRCPVKPTRARS